MLYTLVEPAEDNGDDEDDDDDDDNDNEKDSSEIAKEFPKKSTFTASSKQTLNLIS